MCNYSHPFSSSTRGLEFSLLPFRWLLVKPVHTLLGPFHREEPQSHGTGSHRLRLQTLHMHTLKDSLFQTQVPCLLLPNQTTIPPDIKLNHKALPTAAWSSCWFTVMAAQCKRFPLLQLTDSNCRQEEVKAVGKSEQIYMAVTHSWDPWCLSGLFL